MLNLQSVGYTHPDKELLFNDINLVVNRQDKVALIGSNGAGKSTLLKIMAGILQPTVGHVKADTEPYYLPQHFGQYNNYTVAQALRVDKKLNALNAITDGDAGENNFTILDDDWAIEKRCHEALAYWALDDIDLVQSMSQLSGGQKTKVFLAGLSIHKPAIVLMDEPSNHLDVAGRQLLYSYIENTTATLIVVSHDRTLLNLLNRTDELGRNGITVYGGNYEFYKEQKAIAAHALNEDLRSKEKALRKAKEVEREAMERQQKLDARGKKKQEKSGVPTIAMNTLRNNAEKSTAKTKDVHAEKIDGISAEVKRLRSEMPDKDKMRIGFDDAIYHIGKILLEAKDINFSYGGALLWKEPLSFLLKSGDRIAIKGANGSGKTTLIQIILGLLQPIVGSITKADFKATYIDQDYSLVKDELTLYEQAEVYNTSGLEEHEVKSRLTHFLFDKEYWDKHCSTLSGGERMRLVLCCLTMSREAPGIIILDEPTNNLDIQNVEILTNAIEDYEGTILVISHDEYFLEQIGVQEEIVLE